MWLWALLHSKRYLSLYKPEIFSGPIWAGPVPNRLTLRPVILWSRRLIRAPYFLGGLYESRRLWFMVIPGRWNFCSRKDGLFKPTPSPWIFTCVPWNAGFYPIQPITVRKLHFRSNTTYIHCTCDSALFELSFWLSFEILNTYLKRSLVTWWIK